MRRRPLEHAAAMGALLITFLAVTAGIGTVAASEAPTPRPSPRVLPSVGAAVHSLQRSAVGAQTGIVRSPNARPRPGSQAHVYPPAPLAFTGAGAAPFTDVPGFGGGMQAGIVVDLDSRQVIWQRWPFAPRATASLAKVMTVMVAMDRAPSLDQRVTVPAAGEDDDPQHSVMGLHAGDVVTVRQLVDGVWLASGDDAAETLAGVFEPRQQFISEMNAKAAWLGLTGTHFSNPTGLDDPGEFSTPYDLAVMSAWLWLHYPSAFELARQRYVPLWLRGQDYGLRTLNKMVDQFPGLNAPYPGANGLKTGDTPGAGGCVIATAQRGGRRLIAIVMNSDWFFTDAGALLDYGFRVDN